MGGVISAVRSTLNSADDETIKMAKETLDMLHANAKVIEDKFTRDIEDVYKNPNEYDKWQVAGGRMDRFSSFIGVETTDKPSTDITSGVDELAASLFGVVSKDNDTAGKDFKAGVSSMLTSMFNSFLGNASAGESQSSKFLVIPHGFALYRLDVSFYKYNLESKGFKDHYQSITVAVATRGILDMKEVSTSELLSYASDIYGGDVTNITKWLNDFKALFELAQGATGPKKMAAWDDENKDDDADALQEDGLTPKNFPDSFTFKK